MMAELCISTLILWVLLVSILDTSYHIHPLKDGVSPHQGRALRVGKVGSAYLKQNNQVPHFPSGVQLGT